MKNTSYNAPNKYVIFCKGENMSNKEIFEALKRGRKLAAFARFIGISQRQIYNLLKSEKMKDCQYLNYILFLRHLFEE